MAERDEQDARDPPPVEPGLRPDDNTQTAHGPAANADSPSGGAQASAPPWTPPPEFDEFRLEQVIGQGGMGIVYRAQDLSLGRLVAVKFLASREPDPRVLQYFETEARTIARLQHPNVVTVFRVGSVSGHPYIVSEYVVGRSLAQLPRPLPWRQVLTIGLGLARGLAAAHRQGTLHRDVKPSNVLVTESGEVKLLDFGLAERIDRGMSLRTLGTRTLAGTPRYMAPELLRGAPATPQTDIYSLGLTLYELCSGSLPPHALAQKLPDDVPLQESPSAAPTDVVVPPIPPEAGVDPDFEALILRCLAPAPTERFASAELLCAALERLTSPHSSSAQTASNPYRGLAPFEAEHSSLFFGRDADIRAVVERLHRQSVVLVVGDPGVGKSSLCRAGVLPRVTSDALSEGRTISTVTLWPGARPLQALASALAPLLGRKEAELVTALTETPAALGQALREAFPGRRGLLLFIDQLEELITLAEPEQAARFATFLGELALPSAGVRLLLAVRGNFLTSVGALPGLAAEIERALYLLQPMHPEGIREAIVGPARGHGVVFESEDLIQNLIASALDGAGSLPLLQFALAELWERRHPVQGRITVVALSEMGGVAGALSRHADGVLAQLSAAEQQAARRMLVQLVTSVGLRVLRSEEELIGTRDAASRAALHALAEERVLHVKTEGGKAWYELAHDALVVSWGTLRNWLDDDIGHRAVRQRVEAASTEWERLTKARDALWGQRQLDEARPLDPQTLTPRARAFLSASRRALRLQRWGRSLAALGVVLALAGVYLGLRLQAYLEDKRFIADELTAARAAMDDGHEFGKQARKNREEALALFDGQTPAPGKSTDPQAFWQAAERRWREALGQLDQADKLYARAVQSTERALERNHGQREARELRLEALRERLLLAELFHQQQASDELFWRMDQLLENAPEFERWRKELHAPARLEIETDPPGARVEIEKYFHDPQGLLQREPVLTLDSTPSTPQELPAGSYLLHFSRPDRAPVDLPLLLTRGQKESIRIKLPVAVPKGYVYIPPACFLRGSNAPEEVREFLTSPPLHRVCLSEGFLIGQTEVTFGDWLTYAESRYAEDSAKELLAQETINTAGAITLRHQPGIGWLFSFHRSSGELLKAKDGEPFHYRERQRRSEANWRQFPLSGVSVQDLDRYFYWLDRWGGLPGARLCNEREWEFAARGADGRAFPHGDRLLPDDANIDATYNRQPSSFGPDEVGAHPASNSPFGLRDMAGNAIELTRAATPDLGSIVLRGGSWYLPSVDARAANRAPVDATQRDSMIGVRVCASFTPR